MIASIRTMRLSRIAAVGNIDRLELCRRRTLAVLLVFLPIGGMVARVAIRLRLESSGVRLSPIDPAAALFEPLLWCLIGAGALPFETWPARRRRAEWDSYLSAGLSRAELVCGRALVPAVTGLGTGLLAAIARRIEPGGMMWNLRDWLPPLICFAAFAGLLAVFGSIRTETPGGFGLVFSLTGGAAALMTGRLPVVVISPAVPGTWIACAALLAGSLLLFRNCNSILMRGGQ